MARSIIVGLAILVLCQVLNGAPVCEVPTGATFCGSLGVANYPCFRDSAKSWSYLNTLSFFAYDQAIKACNVVDNGQDPTGCFAEVKNFICSSNYPRCDPRDSTKGLGVCYESCQRVASCPSKLGTTSCQVPYCVVDGTIISYAPYCTDWLYPNVTSTSSTTAGSTSGSSTTGQIYVPDGCPNMLTDGISTAEFIGQTPSFLLYGKQGSKFGISYQTFAELTPSGATVGLVNLPNSFQRTCMNTSYAQNVNFTGTLPNGAHAEVDFWFFTEDHNVTVGNFSYTVAKSSPKFSIRVSNWPWQDVRNQWVIIFLVQSTDVVYNYAYDNGDDIFTGNASTTSNTLLKYQFITWGKMTNQTGTYLRRMGQPTVIVNPSDYFANTLKEIRYSFITPSFISFEYDPDFSVLFTGESSDAKTTNDQDNNKQQGSSSSFSGTTAYMAGGIAIGVVVVILVAVLIIALKRRYAKQARISDQLRDARNDIETSM